MDKQKLSIFTSFAAFGFALFVLLWTVLSYTLLPVAEGQSDYSLMVMDPQWTIIATAGLVLYSLAFAIIGFKIRKALVQ